MNGRFFRGPSSQVEVGEGVGVLVAFFLAKGEDYDWEKGLFVQELDEGGVYVFVLYSVLVTGMHTPGTFLHKKSWCFANSQTL